MTASRQRPRAVFFGGGGGVANVMLSDSGSTDGGNLFLPRFRTNPIIPDIPSRDIICYATFVSYTVVDRISTGLVTVSLYVDNLLAGTNVLALPAIVPGQRTYREEIPWVQRIVGADGVPREVGQAPRGRRVHVELTVDSLGDSSRLIFNGIECEVELVGETVVAKEPL